MIIKIKSIKKISLRYFLELSFNGSNYHGWQIQPNAISVQEVLEDVLSKLLSEEIKIVGAGRTDAGVHASQMYAHFDAALISEIDTFLYKINAFLPKDIAVQAIYEMNDEAHARFDASNRTYVYRIHKKKDVFSESLSYYFKQELDLVAMNKACDILKQYDDFECFSRTHTDVKTFVCNIAEASWSKDGNSITFKISADRFLRNMVRAIVGTMLDIGLGKTTLDELHDIIKSKKRQHAGASAPAHGLYLTEITYPNSIFKQHGR